MTQPKKRVYELARELNMTNKALLEKISSLDLGLNSHMSTLDDGMKRSFANSSRAAPKRTWKKSVSNRRLFAASQGGRALPKRAAIPARSRDACGSRSAPPKRHAAPETTEEAGPAAEPQNAGWREAARTVGAGGEPVEPEAAAEDSAGRGAAETAQKKPALPRRPPSARHPGKKAHPVERPAKPKAKKKKEKRDGGQDHQAARAPAGGGPGGACRGAGGWPRACVPGARRRKPMLRPKPDRPKKKGKKKARPRKSRLRTRNF
jgi:translation initiation factor IF-2